MLAEIDPRPGSRAPTYPGVVTHMPDRHRPHPVFGRRGHLRPRIALGDFAHHDLGGQNEGGCAVSPTP